MCKQAQTGYGIFLHRFSPRWWPGKLGIVFSLLLFPIPVGGLENDQPVARAVITHAHADHARPGSRRYLTSPTGARVLAPRVDPGAQIRALPFGERLLINDVSISLHPAGHLLGSAQGRVEHRGDVSVVSGAYKIDIVKQFFGESVLIAFLSLFLGVLLVLLLLPVFSDLTGKALSLNISENPLLVVGLLGMAWIILMSIPISTISMMGLSRPRWRCSKNWQLCNPWIKKGSRRQCNACFLLLSAWIMARGAPFCQVIKYSKNHLNLTAVP